MAEAAPRDEGVANEPGTETEVFVLLRLLRNRPDACMIVAYETPSVCEPK